MPEEKAKRSVPEWLKAVGSSIFGLVGGAFLMYLTPLVNAVKPPEPTANFGYQAQGLNVTVQNRATNAADGWWDFGDGSPLEQFSAQQQTIAHSYAKPGPYSVKLSLTNLFNEKAERTVTIDVENAGTVLPVIEQFAVTPLSPGMSAPAVFRLTATVKNANEVIWFLGETQPIKVTSDTGGNLEEWVTIDKPGSHTFRIVAVGAKQTIEKLSPPVVVAPPSSADVPMAMVHVSYDAARVESRQLQANVALRWKADCHDQLCPVEVEWKTLPGFVIAKAALAGNGPYNQVRGIPTVTVAPDGSKVMVNAELIRPANLIAKWAQNLHTVPLKVTLEQRGKQQAHGWEVPMRLNMSGETRIPLPGPVGFWKATKREVALDLTEGQRKVWSGSDMPVNRPVQLQGHTAFVTAVVQGNELVLTVTAPTVSPVPIGN